LTLEEQTKINQQEVELVRKEARGLKKQVDELEEKNKSLQEELMTNNLTLKIFQD
jgi:hypothetical protein